MCVQRNQWLRYTRGGGAGVRGQEHEVCIWLGAFPNAALDVIHHTCCSSPPAALLAVNLAFSQTPGSHQSDTFRVKL